MENLRYWLDGIDWVQVGIVVIVAICVALIGVLIANAITATPVQMQGTVADKNYRAGYTTYILQKVGSVYVNTPIYTPPSWSVYVKTDAGTREVEVTSGMYDHLQIGDRFDMACREGGILHDINCEP